MDITDQWMRDLKRDEQREDELKERACTFQEFMLDRFRRAEEEKMQQAEREYLLQQHRDAIIKQAEERSEDGPRVFHFTSDKLVDEEEIERRVKAQKMAEEAIQNGHIGGPVSVAKNEGINVVPVQKNESVMPVKEKVNHPEHYNDTPIETMEMFYLAFHDRPDMIKGALLFNVMKYRDRYRKKNGQEDLDKMHWYLNQLEMHFEEDVSVYHMYHDLKQDQ